MKIIIFSALIYGPELRQRFILFNYNKIFHMFATFRYLVQESCQNYKMGNIIYWFYINQ